MFVTAAPPAAPNRAQNAVKDCELKTLCAKRLALLQSVLSAWWESHNSLATTEPALLIIPGVDGGFNANSQRLVKYLFLGQSGDLLNEPTIDGPDEPLEDCFLLVLRDGVKLYYGGLAATALVAVATAQWPNVEHLRWREGEFSDDAEKAEKFKIQSLVDVMRNCKIVALPTAGVLSEDDDETNHERWPLLQAFGLDEFNSGGFFSVAKQVLHFGKESHNAALGQLLRHVDNIGRVASEEGARLTKHWITSVRLASKQIRDKGEINFDGKDENGVVDPFSGAFEPILSFFEFGSVRDASTKEVKIGRNASVTRLGQRGSAIVLRGEDPSNGVRASRVYFLDAAAEPALVGNYGALVTAFQNTIPHLSTSESKSGFSPLCDPSRPRAERRLHMAAVQVLNTTLVAAKLSAVNPDALKVVFNSFDLAGRNVDAALLQRPLGHLPRMACLHSFELRLDVGLKQGPLCFGNTILFVNDDAVPVLLTEGIPSFLAWHTPSAERSTNVEAAVGLLGKTLPGRHKTPCTVYFGRSSQHAEATVLSGNISFFEQGFVLDHVALGKMVFPLLNEKENEEIDSDDTAADKMTATMWTVSVKQPSDTLVLALEAGPALFDVVPELEAFHSGLCTHIAFTVSGRPELANAVRFYKEVGLIVLTEGDESLSVAQTFAPAPVYTNMVREPSMEEDWQVKAAVSSENKSEEEFDLLDVYIVAGCTEASGKSAVARAIATRLGGAPLLENDFVHAIAFNAARLRKQVSKLRPDCMTVVVVAPGDTTPITIAQTLLDPSHPRIQRCIRVTATTVVNIHHAYRDIRCTNLLPGLLAQCSAPLVKVIVLTGASSNSAANTPLEELRGTLHAWNGEAELFYVGICFPSFNATISFGEDFWAFHDRNLVTYDKSSLFTFKQQHKSSFEARVVYSSEVTLSRTRLLLALERLTKFPEATTEEKEQVPMQEMTFEDLREEGEDAENGGGSASNNRTGICFAQEFALKRVSSEKAERMNYVDIMRLPLPTGEMISVSGIVSLEDGSKKHVAVAACGGVVKLQPLTEAEAEKCGAAKRSLALTFEGISLDDKDAFQAFSAALQPRVEVKLRSIAAKDVSAACRKTINTALAGEPMPPGFWFDGRSYMDHTGLPQEHHPLFHQRLEEWVKNRNKLIDKHNTRVDAQQKVQAQLKLASF